MDILFYLCGYKLESIISSIPITTPPQRYVISVIS